MNLMHRGKGPDGRRASAGTSGKRQIMARPTEDEPKRDRRERTLGYPGEVILDLVSAGMGLDHILADDPELEREDIRA
jgi:hypothetical protein